MKVLKFGGTSVGSIESILSLKSIVESETQPVIVVVSALGGITDKLIAISQQALTGDEQYKEEFENIVKRHHHMVENIIKDETAKKRCSAHSTTSSISCDPSTMAYSSYMTSAQKRRPQ